MTKRKRSAPPQFTGDLAKPIIWTPPERPSAAAFDLLPDVKTEWAREYNAALLSVKNEVNRKIDLLAQHYGVDTSHGCDIVGPLLFCVCSEFVRGFRIEIPKPSRRGRPREWSPSRYTRLIADVEAIKTEKKCSDRDALRELIKRPRYQPRNGVPRSTETLDKAVNALETRLSEAKRPDYNPLAGLVEALRGRDLQKLLFDEIVATENR